jgi:tRNA G18 (ribose-2'-O)-methylase SpoU
MYHVHRIADLDLPELAPYRTLKLPHEHRERGFFVAEGDKVVHRLLASSLEIISVLVPEHRLAEYEPALQTRREDVLTFCVTDKRVLEELVGFEMFQGVMAVAKIPSPPSLSDLRRPNQPPRLFAAADGLTSAENVGVLVRNCVAFGAQALLVGETSASPYLRRAVRNSMGTVFQLPILETLDLAELLQDLRTQGVRCVAAHPHTEQKFLADTDFRTDICIVFGAEGNGISPGVLAACDEAVAIPMPPGVDSLNVASAAAVFLYAASQQQAAHRPKRTCATTGK